MRQSLTVMGLVAALAGAGHAQERGGGQVNPVEELQQALEKMRAAEELLAQSGRDAAAREQQRVETLIELHLDDAEKTQHGVRQKMLRAAAKAAVGVGQHIERVLGGVRFQEGRGSGSVAMHQSLGGQRSEQNQEPQQLERGDEATGQAKPEGQADGGSGTQARAVHGAGGRGGRATARDVDPNVWYLHMPAKLQEDALKERMETWPGRYEDLIREWQKTLAKMRSRRDR